MAWWDQASPSSGLSPLPNTSPNVTGPAPGVGPVPGGSDQLLQIMTTLQNAPPPQQSASMMIPTQQAGAAGVAPMPQNPFPGFTPPPGAGPSMIGPPGPGGYGGGPSSMNGGGLRAPAPPSSMNGGGLRAPGQGAPIDPSLLLALFKLLSPASFAGINGGGADFKTPWA